MNAASYAKLSLRERNILHADAMLDLERARGAAAGLLICDAQVEAARLLPDVARLVFDSDPDTQEVSITKAVTVGGEDAWWGNDDRLIDALDEMVLESLRAAQRIAGNRQFEHAEESRGYQLRLR